MSDDRLFHVCLGHSEKVNMLSDFEDLVWRGYVLTADDFGVMRFSPITLREKFDRFAKRPEKYVQRALERVHEVGLMHLFTHQQRTYCYQRNWQEWQHVRFPKQTKQPLPPDAEWPLCDRQTRWLFEHYPGGRDIGSWKAPKAWRPDVLTWKEQEDNRTRVQKIPPPISEVTSEVISEVISEILPDPLTKKQIKSNANTNPQPTTLRSGPPLDELLDRFLAEMYPKAGYQRNWQVETAWVDAFADQDRSVFWRELCEAVAQHKRSIQWRDGKIPLLGKWLGERRWNQRLPEPDELRTDTESAEAILARRKAAQ